MARANRPRRHRTSSPYLSSASCRCQRSSPHPLPQSGQHKRRSPSRTESRSSGGLGHCSRLVALARTSSSLGKQSARQNGLALAHLPPSYRSSTLELPRNVAIRRISSRLRVFAYLFNVFGLKLAFPSRNHHASHAITQHRNDGASHVHQLIDGKE